MRNQFIVFAGVLTMLGWLFSQIANADDLKVGDPAPDFTLSDQYGKTHSLTQYRGKWVVLYFYPKDDTPGCTEEACHFRDDIVQLNKLGVQVLGISLDSAASHAEFSKKFGLPFPLLADEEASVAKSYQALTNLGIMKFAKRHSFIIDPQGKLAVIYRKVDTSKHSDEIIAAVKKLQAEKRP